MSVITASMVKQLRERTGVGMLECQKALKETAGDIESAIDLLRTRGQAKAAKKAGRTAAEGAIAQAFNAQVATMVEVNCETDFSAKNDFFLGFADHVAKEVLADPKASPEDYPALEAKRLEQVSVIGENIQFRRLLVVHAVPGGVLGCYCHDHKLGVIVSLKGGSVELARQLGMHIVASRPKCLTSAQVSVDDLNREKEIFRSQAAESGKPKEIVEKTVEGRIQKYFKEICLVEQPFVMHPDKKVGAILKAAGAEVVSFHFFELGEGIEKTVTDFAAEVAQVQAQSKGS